LKSLKIYPEEKKMTNLFGRKEILFSHLEQPYGEKYLISAGGYTGVTVSN
jgi:hypothetical protein